MRKLTAILTLLSLCLLGAAPNTGTTTASGSGNPFKLVDGYLTEDSRLPLRNLERMQGVDYLPEYYISPGAVASGTVTGGGTTSSFIDSSQSWAIGSLVGLRLRITFSDPVNPAGLNSEAGQKILTVTRNNATTVYFEPALRSIVQESSTYEIYDGVLPPGNDTTGKGTKGAPWQSWAKANEAFAQGAKVMLDCAEFLSSRDAGGVGPAGTYQIGSAGGAIYNGGVIRPENEVSAMLSTPVECGRKPARITFDTPRHANGFLLVGNPPINNQTDTRGPVGITYALENIVSSGPYSPKNQQDFVYTTGDANIITLNVGIDSQRGFFNQLFTSHGSTSQVSLNSKIHTADLTEWERECDADNRAKVFTIASITQGPPDKIVSTAHGYLSGERILFRAGSGGSSLGGVTFATTAGYQVENATQNDFELHLNGNLVDIGTLTGSVEGYQFWEACEGDDDITNSNYNFVNFAGGSLLMMNSDYHISDSQYDGGETNTSGYVLAGEAGAGWYVWNTASTELTSPVAGATGMQGYQCAVSRGNYSEKTYLRCDSDNQGPGTQAGNGHIVCPPDVRSGSVSSPAANYPDSELTNGSCLFVGNSYFQPVPDNNNMEGSTAFRSTLTRTDVVQNGGISKVDVTLFQNSATNADVFWQGEAASAQADYKSMSVWGACNFAYGLDEHLLTVPATTVNDIITSFEFKQTAYQSGTATPGDQCTVDINGDGIIACAGGPIACGGGCTDTSGDGVTNCNRFQCGGGGQPACDVFQPSCDNTVEGNTALQGRVPQGDEPNTGMFEFGSNLYDTRAEVIAANLPFIDAATFMVEDRNLNNGGSTRPLGIMSSTGDAPNCTSWDCWKKCTVSLKKSWPAEEKVFWTGAFKALIGEEVKGLYLNRNKDGNIGAPLSGSGADLF